MASEDPKPPVADDDFPEFAAPPQHQPGPTHSAREKPADVSADNGQGDVDDLIARLRRERAEGKR